MRPSSAILLCAVSLIAACRAKEIVGAYRGELGAMTVSRDGEEYVIALKGGGPPCEIRARGTLISEKTFIGQFIAFETDDWAYDAKAAQHDRRRLEISFGPEGAEITRADTFGYCGNNVSFDGPALTRR